VLWAEAEETASSELPAARRQKRRLDFGFMAVFEERLYDRGF
jgi:hypothetical protein